MSEGKDPELEMLRLRKLMSLMNATPQRVEKAKAQLTPGEVKERIIALVKGERTREIVENAIALYGDTAVAVLSKVLRLIEEGALSQLTDVDLYNILENVGLHVPLKTRIRVIRHGREVNLGED